MPLQEPTICSKCHKTVDLVNADRLCKNCFDLILIPQSCNDCGHQWENSKLSYCPSCGSVKGITTKDNITATWLWEKECLKEGLQFAGINQGYKEIPDSPLFYDPKSRTTFCIHNDETLAIALHRVRIEFGFME